MLFTREQLEANEQKTLAPYGMHSAQTKGRLYPEDEALYRTVYQRDRDRVLHTTAFRRLEYKTQVFVNAEGDYYRTRLTHTLEVAQVGRTFARAIGANEDLVEAICLAHDLGHSPFGHSGERTLNLLMAEHNGFDHNKQSLRIVTELEHRYPDYPGLNLAWETLEGMVKHETEYDESDASKFDPHLRGNIEAQIANVADELAYTAHDLDDGLRSGMIVPAQLNGQIHLWEKVKESIGWDGQNMDQLTCHRLIRRLIGLEMTDLVSATNARIDTAQPQSTLDVQSLDHDLIQWGDEFVKMNRQLKDFLYKNLYNHFRVVRMAEKAQRFISDLFNAYVHRPSQLPPQAQERIEVVGLHRAACDYIAGMTDRYALLEHARLYDPHTRP